MGLFSSLFHNNTGAADAAAAGDASPASSSAEPRAPLNPAPPVPDTPFAPPAVWSDAALNVDALTAPAETPANQPTVGPPDPVLTAELQGPIIEVIKTVFDPEIPVDIYELGLVYDIVVDTDRNALIRMTLTSPACPSAQQLPSEVRYKVKAVDGVKDATVEIVWEPPWDKDRMSEAAKLQLGLW